MNAPQLWRLLAHSPKNSCGQYGTLGCVVHQTRHMSQVLPKLPIPPLHQSLEKYLR